MEKVINLKNGSERKETLAYIDSDPELKKIKDSILRVLDKQEKLRMQNKKILDRTKFLDWNSFSKQVKYLNKKIKFGYYKNQDGDYVHVRGIEVYGNTGDLCRMGFNGEDRGVFVHYTEISGDSITTINVPTYSFTIRFDKALTKKSQVLHPCTKEDYDKKVLEVIEATNREYKDPDGIEWGEFVDYVDKYTKLSNKHGKLCDELWDEFHKRNIKLEVK